MRLPVILLLLSVFGANDAQGQLLTNQDQNLQYVDAVFPMVLLGWDDDLEQYDEDTVRSRIQTLFESELSTLGIPINTSVVGNEVKALIYTADLLDNATIGFVAYNVSVSVIDLVADYSALTETAFDAEVGTTPWSFLSGQDAIRALIWQRASLGTVGRDNLLDALERTARERVQEFANDWLAANSR